MNGSEAPVPAFSAVCRDLLSSGVAVRFQAFGNSMRPTIRDGEEIDVAPIRGISLRPGDIAMYATFDGREVCHRFLRQRRDGKLVFRGDAAWAEEDLVEPSRVLGIALAVQRNGKRRRLRGRAARLRDSLRRLAGRVHGALTAV
jgi:hypothetical protein